jgi:drug/metabolite transporter (DMT)-like permease
MVLGRALRNQVGPFTLSAGRVLTASLVYLPLLLRLPPPERRLGREWPWLLGMALLGIVGCPVTLYLALHYTTASSTSMINGFGPLITAFLAAWLLHTRLTRGQLAGAILSMFGVLLVIGGKESGAQAGMTPEWRDQIIGDLIMVVNVIMWGLYSIMSRVVTRRRAAIWAVTFSTWFAVPFLVPAAALEWRQTPPTITVQVVLAILWIGVFATCLGNLAWNEGVRRVGPVGANAFYNMLPVFGVALGALFLGERLAPVQFLGGGLIIAGGLLAALWARDPAPVQVQPSATQS